MTICTTQNGRASTSAARPRKREAARSALLICMFFVPAGASAELVTRTGNIELYLNNFCIPGAGTEVFDEPSQSDMDDWRAAIALLTCDIGTTADIADAQLYDLVEYTDTVTGRLYYVLAEQFCPGSGCSGQSIEPCRGLGAYVYYPDARRELNLQLPHARVDGGTWAEGIAMFVALEARFLQITGTHRCANAAESPCSGTTFTCSEDEQPYRESDVAHFTNNFFQATSNEVAAQAPDLVAISVHGFGACSGDCPDDCTALTTSLAQVSNGTGCGSSDVPNSLATQLAIAYNDVLSSLPTPYPGRGAGSCNWSAGEPPDAELAACPEFCGGTNAQGRAINGSPSPCTQGVCTALLPERFLHVEQQGPLRQPPPGSTFPGVSWQVTIDAIAATFPPISESWVDFDYNGSEIGSICQPYDMLAEAINVADWDETIIIKAGSSPETMVIASGLILRSFGGSARVGQ